MHLCEYDAFFKAIIPATTVEQANSEDNTPDKEVDLDAVPKYILACKKDRPSPDVLPYWNIAEYEKILEHFRQS